MDFGPNRDAVKCIICSLCIREGCDDPIGPRWTHRTIIKFRVTEIPSLLLVPRPLPM
jgi:hypothetical protein